jgi:HEAT repeat protein
VDSVPLEQSFHLSSQPAAVPGPGTGSPTLILNAVAGAEIRADLGQAPGAQGLHLDTFDDWPMAGPPTDVAGAFARLLPLVEESRRRALKRWAEETDGDWDRTVPDFFRGVLALDPTEETRSALAHATATWMTGMLARHRVARAARALELLNELDPEHARCGGALARGLDQIDPGEFAEYLDEAEPAEQGLFAGLMVRLDSLATPFTFHVMARAARSRTRAAAATALCYQCADHPERLQPFIDDPRADIVLNLVFVLGQIGGPGVVDMLRLAAAHTDPRVRRQAVLSLGGVPEAQRVPVLLDELAQLDPHILGVTLSMLARHQNKKVSRFIVHLMEDAEFQTRSEDVQRSLFNALAEVAEDGAVPALERLLSRGHGWSARHSFTQFAAAVTLRRLGTPGAKAALEAGLKSRNASVRSACGEAMNAGAA